MMQHKRLLVYLARFLGLFCLLFYGTEAVIGLSSPGNHYSPFVANYLDFITPFRYFLLLSAKAVVSLFGYRTYFSNQFTLALVGGSGVRLIYSCIGYGVLSFWVAFVFANNGTWQKKAWWIIGGSVALVFINVIRIALLLIVTNKHWPIPLGWDHHTWFNIVAYLLIFGMIYLYDRAGRTTQPTRSEPVLPSAKAIAHSS